jgi:glycerate kinase
MHPGGHAVIEMAAASGLLLAGGRDLNDPMAATTRGTGELIAAATVEGATRIIVGLGGSATTDGGAGALEALREHPAWSTVDPTRRPELVVCCDVRTTFVRAAEVFGPQKGADPRQVRLLRTRLTALAGRYAEEHGVDVTTMAGSGAAGGLAGGLAVLGGRLLPGFDVVAAEVGLDEALAGADLVVTGEGFLDAGSFDGKVVGGVAARAAARGIPVVAVVGDHDGTSRHGLAVLGLVERFGRDEAMVRTVARIRELAGEHLAALAGRRPGR